MTKLVSINPANYKKIGSVTISSTQEIKQKVELANKTKLKWKELGLKKRIQLLKPLCNEFLKNKKQLISLITKEMGKPLKQAQAEFEDGLFQTKWFLDNAEKYLKDEITCKNNKVVYEPLGTAAVITPWNYPFEMPILGIIPNLIVGNTVVFKHSEECPLMGKLIENMFNKLPKGVFSEIYGHGKQGSFLVQQNIDLIWFTGSSKVGKKLYELAGKKFIKSLMELGGSNPGIVFKDADIDKVLNKIYSTRFNNCGQICCALKRLIVHENVFDKVVEKLAKLVQTKKLGNPNEKDTDIASLVSKKQLKLLKLQVKDAVKKGAKVVIGGKSPEKLKGAYFLPTILTNIAKDMDVWKQEVFGPVLPVIKFKTEEQAIKLANDTPYGLGAYAFTKNKKLFLRVASKIDAGTISLNNGSTCALDPFGGYKDSGKGRELGKYSFHELVQIKVVAKG